MYSKTDLIYTHRILDTDIRVKRITAGEYKNVETGERITRYQLNDTYKFAKRKSSILRTQLNLPAYKATLPSRHLVDFKITPVIVGSRRAWRVFFGSEELDTFATKFEALAYVREKAST